VLSKDNKGWYVLNDNDEKLFYDLDIIKSMFIPSGNTWGNICLDESNQEENVNTEEVNKTIKEFTEDESEDKEEEYSYQNNYN
jgi:hypothetical protein